MPKGKHPSYLGQFDTIVMPITQTIIEAEDFAYQKRTCCSAGWSPWVGRVTFNVIFMVQCSGLGNEKYWVAACWWGQSIVGTVAISAQDQRIFITICLGKDSRKINLNPVLLRSGIIIYLGWPSSSAFRGTYRLLRAIFAVTISQLILSRSQKIPELAWWSELNSSCDELKIWQPIDLASSMVKRNLI